MIIAHILFSVSAANRELAIDTLNREANAIRTMQGCVTFLPFLDPANSQTVGVLHEWESSEDFEAYIASSSFKTIGEILHPIMTSPPQSKRFDAKRITA